ncbi:MAG: translation initiation factor IF-2 [Myxococcota bacterium]|jgi:translation initiation factor IF-2|nr:translation initiation factor IF-2 [Myxococcota bacterium]
MVQKIRVFKLAQELGFDNDTMVSKIAEMGLDVRNYMSAIDQEVALKVRRQLERERVESTVEQAIKPGVVKRTRVGGAPPPKVAKTKPPKSEPSREEIALEAAAKKTRKPVVKATPALEPAVETKVPVQTAEPQAPKPPVIREGKAAIQHKPASPVGPTPSGPEPAPAPVALPQGVVRRGPTSTPAPVRSVEPAPVRPTPAPPSAPGRGFQPPRSAQSDPSAEEPTSAPESGDRKPRGIEVAMGPITRRPANQAPVIKRRISVTPPPPNREGSSRPQRETRDMRVSPPTASIPPMPNLFSPPPPPAPGSPPAAGDDRNRAGGARRREIESRDIAPSGRFTGVGPSKFTPGGPGRKRKLAPGKKGRKTEITTPKASKRIIRIEAQISLQELAKRMGVKSTELIAQLMSMGVGTININSTLDADTAKIVASDFGYDVENVAVGENELLASTRSEETEAERANREMRPPVVTMMGHVDHGKTSLLDFIRKANVAGGEAGGITQHIGAYRVKASTNQHLTFIDTPGHEAFTAMRARGANVTDIVVLVCAADDGVMPQTIEAINHARAAKVPIIVAINKCDMPTANPERTRRMLLEQALISEDLGGETIMVEVSAKTGQGVDKLLEMIALQSEVMELDANPQRAARGVVLEAYLDRGRGPVANVLVQEGTLNMGDFLVVGSSHGKIRALTDEFGRKVKNAFPSTPVEILGLETVPGAGDSFDVVSDMKTAEKVAKSRFDKDRSRMSLSTGKPSLEALYEQMQGSDQVELRLIIKTDVQGTMEALRDSLEKQSTEKVKVAVVHSSVGGITESDVLLASTAGAIIIGFNVRPAGKARTMAEEQGVEIRLFSIIYEVIDSVKAAMLGLLSPEVREETLGSAEVRETFTIPKIGTIAGLHVTSGKIVRSGRARLFRDAVQVWQGRIGSLRRFKDDVKEVQSGFECGISFDGCNDIRVGDVIEVFVEKQFAATMD